MNIWVEEPETIKDSFMSKPYTMYSICYLDEFGSLRRVKHRYSEFEALQSVLMARHGMKGLLIPPLPGKKVVNNTSKDFVLARMRGLNIFVDRIGEFFCKLFST